MSLLIRIAVIFVVIRALVPPLDAAAQGDLPRPDKTLSPYFFVEGGDPAIDRLPLKDTRVDVAIAGVIADVTVRQVYENRGTRPIHARYVFPASTRAAVYGMTMTVGDVRTVATNQGARAGRARIRRGQARGQERLAAGTEPPQRVHDEAGQRAAGRHDRRRAQVHRAARADRRRVRVRLPDGRRTAVLRKAREPGVRRKIAFVKAPYTHQGEAPRSEFHLAGVVSTGVPVQELASPSHQLDVRASGLARGDRARRLGAIVRQPRLHPSLPVGGRGDRLRTAAVSGPRTRTSSCSWRSRRRSSRQTRCRRANTSSCSTCRDR